LNVNSTLPAAGNSDVAGAKPYGLSKNIVTLLLLALRTRAIKLSRFARFFFALAAWPRIGFVAVPSGPLYQYCDVDACTHWPLAKAPTPMLESAATPTGFFSQNTKRKNHEVQRLTATFEFYFTLRLLALRTRTAWLFRHYQLNAM
jgi:hypothetical protein